MSTYLFVVYSTYMYDLIGIIHLIHLIHLIIKLITYDFLWVQISFVLLRCSSVCDICREIWTGCDLGRQLWFLQFGVVAMKSFVLLEILRLRTQRTSTWLLRYSGSRECLYTSFYPSYSYSFKYPENPLRLLGIIWKIIVLEKTNYFITSFELSFMRLFHSFMKTSQ
jgi:hypothetical protein